MGDYKMGIRDNDLRVTYDIGIIGAGTAGLTAAIYGARAGRSVALIEPGGWGGAITTTDRIENYPGISDVSGIDFAEGLASQVKKLGCTLIPGRAAGIFLKEGGLKEIVLDNDEKVCARTVIIAVGTHPRRLGVPEEESFAGRGLSYCATCDGAFYRNRRVAVVGGGNSALSEALYLSKLTELVYLINKHETFNGEEKLVREIEKTDNVKLLCNSEIVHILGEGSGSSAYAADYGALPGISGIELKKAGTVSRLDVSGVFVAIGYEPQNGIFSNVADLENGYIVTDENCETRTRGIFAAGDARSKKVRQLTTAAADGTIAALAASKYLK